MKRIKNETGVFRITENGELCGYKQSPQYPFNNLIIPEGVCILGENAFRGYDIYMVVLPDSLKMLGTGKGGAFSNCYIGEIRMPKNTVLGPNTFSGSYIGKVIVPEEADINMMRQLAHALRFAYIWEAEKMMECWPEECKAIYKGKSENRDSYQQISNDSGTYYIDSDGILMAYNCNDSASFENPNITRIQIPEGVKAIPHHMFCRINVLWELSFPKSLKFIGNCGNHFGAFVHCQLPNVVLPENLELLGNYSFAECTIQSLTIPGTLKNSLLMTNGRQFKDCRIGEIRVPLEYKDQLKEMVVNDYWDHFVYGELSDPELGELCCLRAERGSINDHHVVYLLRLMACRS